MTLLLCGTWLILTIIFAGADKRALVVFVTMSALILPSAGYIFAQRRPTLGIFVAFVALSHVLAPPFFFLERDNYSFFGSFGAVQNFDFSLGQFFRFYTPLLVLLALILLFSLMIDRLILDRALPLSTVHAEESTNSLATGSARGTIALATFVFLVGIPVSLFMYIHRIGVTGVLSDPLPFRLTGILYYSRFFLFPVALFALYSRSSRSFTALCCVLIYAVVAGFASASRYQALISCAPAIVFGVLDRKTFRTVVASVAALALFGFVSASRDFTYSTDSMLSLPELIWRVVTNGEQTFSILGLVGGLANRMWGPQDVVLAAQYSVSNPASALVDYFSVHHNRIVPNLTYDFYGLVFAEDSGFGVGIGYLPWMVVLIGDRIWSLFATAIITALLLSGIESIRRSYQRIGGPLTGLAGPLAFFAVYSLYTSSLNWLYELMILASIFLASVMIWRRATSRKTVMTAVA